MVVEGVGLVLLFYSKRFIDLISTANFIFGRMFGRKFSLCVVGSSRLSRNGNCRCECKCCYEVVYF